MQLWLTGPGGQPAADALVTLSAAVVGKPVRIRFVQACHVTVRGSFKCTHTRISTLPLSVSSIQTTKTTQDRGSEHDALLKSHAGSVMLLYLCVVQVFNELNGDSWSSMSALRDCIGNIEEDRDNSIMEAEMASQRGDADTGEVCTLLLHFNMLLKQDYHVNYLQIRV